MTHEMRLNNLPFTAIKLGEKRMEMRLFDEKRALLSVGDEIVFTNTDTEERLLCRVKALYRYPNFEELYLHHNKRKLGYEEGEMASPEDMLAYYTKEQIQRYGVVGIEIEMADGQP